MFILFFKFLFIKLLKFYFFVHTKGVDSPDQESPSILSIDWTPNVLPISKIGELKITFEYGHIHSHL